MNKYTNKRDKITLLVTFYSFESISKRYGPNVSWTCTCLDLFRNIFDLT